MAAALALIELGLIFAAICATIFLSSGSYSSHATNMSGPGVLLQTFGFSLCCIVAFYYTDLYDFRAVRSFREFVFRTPKSFGIVLLLMTCLSALLPPSGIDAASLLASLLVILGALLPCRAVAYEVMQNRLCVKRVLILGTTALAHKLIQEIEAQPHFGYAILGVVVDNAAAPAEPNFHYPPLGPLERLDEIIEEVRPDRIIVALAERRKRFPVHQFLEYLVRGIVVEDGVEVYERLTGKLAIESLTPSSLIFSKDFRKPRLALSFGRGISLVASVVGLVGFAPLLGLIALAIKLDSRGPVFCVQDRVGMGGKRFKLIKFRTMHPVDGDTSLWFQDNCKRITRVGKWLRKFRLDELPQFVNILQGDMNLIGPRPQRVPKFELLTLVSRNAPQCGQSIPYYSLRSTVPPGVTGWAQVRYRYASDLEEEIEKLGYDLYYIKHLSIWLDFRILFDTVKVVLMGLEARAQEADRGVTHPVLRNPRKFVKTG